MPCHFDRPTTAAAAFAGALVLLVLPVGGFSTSHAAAEPASTASSPTFRQQPERTATLDQITEAPEILPEGPGREESFYRCTACHSTAVIRRSRLSRDRWDELMDWMTERHGMPLLEGEERRLIVDYLAGAFPPQEKRRRGSANPFLTD